MKNIFYCFFSIFLCFLLGCQKPEHHFLDKREIYLNFTQDPSTLDPRKNADYISSAVHFLLYEGLFTISPKGVEPAIAESYELSSDKKVYTFHLKESKWSNGDLVTAYDFEKTWKDMLTPDFPCPNAHLLYPIKNAKKVKRGLLPMDALGIYALNATTFQVELEHPTPYFLDLISFCVFYPVNQQIACSNTSWAEQISPLFTTNGAFQIESWKRGSEIILKKNPFYWNEQNIQLEKIIISVIDSENTALHMFENKQLDLIGLPYTSIPFDSIPDLREKNLIKTTPTAASTVCFFNVNVFPFHNKNIRKAFALAINRQEIVDNITQLNEPIGLDFVPPALKDGKSYHLFEDNDVENAKYHLDIGLKELGISLDELGTLTYMHSKTDDSSKIAQAIQEQWRKVLGVNVQLKSFEYKVFMNNLVIRDYQIAMSRWVAQYPDQMNILERFIHVDNPKNYGGWYNKKYNTLIKDSVFYENREERFALLEEAEKVLAEEMPFTILYHWNSTYLRQPHLQNLEIYPVGGFHIQGLVFPQSD
ncbi:MAG: peptide ABC transporter substrate-binding protein [Chlamydiales bacterium]|nr:peptide ABC transporter substrate-binding protein [Chlamydiales bacterium]